MNGFVAEPSPNACARSKSQRPFCSRLGCSLIAPELRQVPHLLQSACNPVLVVPDYIPVPALTASWRKALPRAVASTLFSLRSPWNSTRICGLFRVEAGMGEVRALEFDTRARKDQTVVRIVCSRLLVIRPIVELTVATL